MIIVKNRELLIPGPERYIGTTYDTESENRQFLLSRFAQNGVDLSALTFRLDLKYANDATDTVVLDKEVTDTNIILTWDIGSSVLQVPGTLFIQLRAVDDEVTVKWSSFHAALYVERHLNTPGTYSGSLTEIEQMEQDHQYMKGVVDELKSHLDYTHEAEAWAIGKKDGEDVPSTDETYHNNSKYYRQQAERYANGKEDGTPVSSGVGYHDNAKYYSEQSDGFSNVSEAYAKGTVDGTPVSSGQTGYQDNAKYYKDQAAATVADTNTRFDNAVAAVTVNTEVQDARVGADGTTYTVLKNRLDAEHTDVKSALDNCETAILTGILPFYVAWVDGTISGGTAEATSSTRKRTKDFLDFENADVVNVTVPSGKRIIYWEYSAPDYSTMIRTQTWQSSSFTLNPNGKYYKFVISDDPEGSERVSEAGFEFVADSTYLTELDKKIADNQEFMRMSGRNLFDPTEAVDKITITTGGAESGNSSYWTTGFIDIDGVEKLLIPVDQKLRYCWYSSASVEGFLSYGTLYNPLTVPTGARYIRVSYAKNKVAFEDRWKLFFCPYDSDPSFETYTALNQQNIVERDGQYFSVSGTYTESFSFSINRGNQGVKNQIVSYKGNYTGDTAPTIRFTMPYNHQSNLYESQTYSLDEGQKQWRVPAFPDNATRMMITVEIPTGGMLTIKHLSNAYDNAINRSADGYTLWSHLGTGCIYPANTDLAFNSAASLGYPGCVTVPKRTSDGVWVCFHDDSNVGNTLRMPDGSNLPSADAAKSISDFTYTELMGFDAGIRRSPFYAGEKVPTLASFFSLCQKTGMIPILSVHPIPSVTEWAEIKTLSDQYNVTDKLMLKFGSATDIPGAFTVFGDSAGGYALVVSTEREAVEQMLALGLSVSHATLGIEWTDTLISAEKAANAISHGFWVGVFIQYGTAARYKELLAMGVTEITDDNNCSFGLNW